MNLILLTKNDLSERNVATLNDRRHQHITKVLRSKVGDRLNVGMINGKLGKAIVLQITDQQTELKVELKTLPPQAPKLTLILALPRPIVLKRMLSTIASLGIKDIYLIQTNRVEKSYWKSPVLEGKNIEHQFLLGLEQAKDTIVPNIHLKKKFKPFVEDELPLIIKKKMALIAHPEGISLIKGKITGPLVLAIGPEGGFIPYEIERLTSLGFQAFRSGRRILRVETALPFILGKLL